MLNAFSCVLCNLYEGRTCTLLPYYYDAVLIKRTVHLCKQLHRAASLIYELMSKITYLHSVQNTQENTLLTELSER